MTKSWIVAEWITNNIAELEEDFIDSLSSLKIKKFLLENRGEDMFTTLEDEFNTFCELDYFDKNNEA